MRSSVMESIARKSWQSISWSRDTDSAAAGGGAESAAFTVGAGRSSWGAGGAGADFGGASACVVLSVPDVGSGASRPFWR